MNKSYSNKALPSGTVLREWRLEEVLGVGGFGIVYKGRGLYFDELVAIKEYFPSSISERNNEDTVVPIDSDAEEVHALGLKKFVEEAKLLWNLSTPSRHPNIVSVRSLFEIHGTAYMVMDFEDGLSLSKLLKQGRRFNEASLKALIRPIAEGLERAHRVGVLHRDIKPPNILVNDDGRPVLIDFGSARFESGEATSTKVTFHTPPYAALEQYVKTFPQGPWTDIYALGVVLYECITGEKPPEVLERMHGGLGTKLSDGHWPGYSRPFLAAVDAAMAIKPEARPQSISAWLELFDQPANAPFPASDPEEADEATRVVPFDTKAEKILPVAPALPGFDKGEKVATAVPEHPSEVEFKGAGQSTGASRKHKTAADAHAAKPQAKASPEGSAPAKKKAGTDKPESIEPPKAKSKRGVLIGSAVAGALVLAGAGFALFKPGANSSGEAAAVSDLPIAEETPVVINDTAGLLTEMKALLATAIDTKAPPAAVQSLSAAADKLGELQDQFNNAGQGAAQSALSDQMYALAKDSAAAFVGALVRDADGKAARLGRDLAWADPRKGAILAKETPARQRIARTLRDNRQALAAAFAAAGSAEGPADAIAAARSALASSQGYSLAVTRAYGAGASRELARAEATAQSASTAANETATQAPETSSAPAEVAGSATKLFPAKVRSFNSIVSSAKKDAQKVVKLGGGRAPGDDASDQEKENYRIREAGVKTARQYMAYLDTLSNSMRGSRTEREVDQLIASAKQTEGYISFLLQRSTNAK